MEDEDKDGPVKRLNELPSTEPVDEQLEEVVIMVYDSKSVLE